jgi:hypothetical protein
LRGIFNARFINPVGSKAFPDLTRSVAWVARWAKNGWVSRMGSDARRIGARWNGDVSKSPNTQQTPVEKLIARKF